MGLALTTRLISLEEGCKLTAYKDTRGIWTIGYGYNLEAHGYAASECEGMTWTQEQADEALADEINAVLAELDRRWPKWRDLDEVRQAAIVSSVYQLGAAGAVQFKGTIAALQARNWASAAAHIRNSRWATQTPKRVERNAEMIQTGEWPEEVNGTKFMPAVDPAPQLAATLVQPAPRRVPTGHVDEPGNGTTMGDAVRNVDLPAVGPATLGGIKLSKKLCVAIAGMLVVLLNSPLHLGLSYGDCSELVKIVGTYLLGQSGVDIFKPLIAKLFKGAGDA